MREIGELEVGDSKGNREGDMLDSKVGEYVGEQDGYFDGVAIEGYRLGTGVGKDAGLRVEINEGRVLGSRVRNKLGE